MFDTIAFAVDPFGHADVALPVTSEIARKFDSEVVVLHVRGSSGSFAEQPREAIAVAERFADRLQDEGVNTRVDVRGCRGPWIGREIVADAQQEGAGLIVVGSRGLSSLGGLLFGSVSQEVQHLARCPVLVVRY